MIEIDVETKRRSVAIAQAEPVEYLVLGDFGGHAPEPRVIDRDNFDDVLTSMEVKLAGSQFRTLDDFHPDHLYLRLDIFREFDRAAPQKNPAAPEPPQADLGELLKSPSLLEQIVEGGDSFEKYMRELARAHAGPKEFADPARDAALTGRMCGLLQDPRFQTIEAAWRGLDFVLRREDSEGDGDARIRIVQFPKEEVSADLMNATGLRDTRMNRLFSARKWTAVIGTYAFGPEAADIELLGRIALIAGHAGVPFIAEGSPDMGPHWEELRGVPEAAYLGLALPRLLMRLPYGESTGPIDSFAFEEMPGAPEHAHYLWGSPALACLALMTGARDALSLEGLPFHSYQRDGEWTATSPAEVWMTEAQALALIDAGLMPLVAYRDSDHVRLGGFRTINGASLFSHRLD